MTTTDFAELHDDLRAVAGDVLARDRVVDWARMIDTGWAALEVPDELGGAAATFAETAVICQELGRAAATTHFLGSAVLVVGLLNALAPSAVRDDLLADISTGKIRAATVIGKFTLSPDRRLSGSADFVPDVPGADRLLVLATDSSGTDVVVDVAGLAVTAQPVLDQTRAVATVAADGIEVAESAVLRFAGHGGAQTVRNRAALAVACDSLGLAEAMLARTVTYVRARTQFGRPIGSFQAVKHACADMLVRISVARALVDSAVDTLVSGASEGADADAAVAMAKSYTCAVAVEVVGKALQLHGGIGYTWESGIHAYLKRATFNRSLFGSPSAHRQYLAQRY